MFQTPSWYFPSSTMLANTNGATRSPWHLPSSDMARWEQAIPRGALHGFQDRHSTDDEKAGAMRAKFFPTCDTSICMRIQCRWYQAIELPLRVPLALQRRCAASWLNSYSTFHSLIWCTSWIWSCRKWYQCNPLVSQEGVGLHHLIASLSALRWVSGKWSTPSMRPSSIGPGRALCT